MPEANLRNSAICSGIGTTLAGGYAMLWLCNAFSLVDAESADGLGIGPRYVHNAVYLVHIVVNGS